MKNTKTTIRELSSRYRDILKKCFFLNAVALALFVATAANADVIDVIADKMKKEQIGWDITASSDEDGSFAKELGKEGDDIFDSLTGESRTVVDVLNLLGDEAKAVKDFIGTENTAAAGDPSNATGVYKVFEEKQEWISEQLGVDTTTTDVKTKLGTDFTDQTEDGKVGLVDAVLQIKSETEAAIAQEVTDRTNADTTLQTNIDNEALTRSDADTAHNLAITGLDERMGALETTVGDDSSGLVKSVADLETTVGDDSSGLVKSVADLETTVGDDSSGLVKSIADLETTVGDDSSGLVKSVNDNATAIAQEVTDRTNADTTLQTNIDNEALTRGEADTAHSQAITDLDGRMTTAEGQIVAEAQARSDADTAHSQAIDALGDRMTTAEGQITANAAASEAQFARLDSKINKLEKKMEKGLAANNALAGLVPLDHVHRTQISAAMGGYEDKQAVAVGAFHYLNERTLLNAGIAYGGNDSASYKVGVTFGF